MRADLARIRVVFGASIQSQEATSSNDSECDELNPNSRYDWSGMAMRIVTNSTVTNSASVSAARSRSS